MLTVGENTANSPTFKPRPLNLYVVAEDCAPSKDNEGILFIRKGQVGEGEGGREGGRGQVSDWGTEVEKEGGRSRIRRIERARNW